MIDGRYYHSFVPGFTKFDGFETDDYVPEETSYVAGTVRGLARRVDAEMESTSETQLPTPFNPNTQGQDLGGSVSKFTPR